MGDNIAVAAVAQVTELGTVLVPSSFLAPSSGGQEPLVASVCFCLLVRKCPLEALEISLDIPKGLISRCRFSCVVLFISHKCIATK